MAPTMFKDYRIGQCIRKISGVWVLTLGLNNPVVLALASSARNRVRSVKQNCVVLLRSRIENADLLDSVLRPAILGHYYYPMRLYKTSKQAPKSYVIASVSGKGGTRRSTGQGPKYWRFAPARSLGQCCSFRSRHFS